MTARQTPLAPVVAFGGDDAASPRSALRARTALLHQGLDAALAAIDIADPEGFADFLSLHALARQRLAPWLGPFDGLAAPESGLESLARDLEALGRPWPQWELPVPAPRGGAPHPAGLSYVICSSALGGRLLRRRWLGGAGSGLEAEAGRFMAQLADTGPWKAFLRWDEATAQPRSAVAAMADGAIHAFEVYRTAAASLCVRPAGQSEETVDQWAVSLLAALRRPGRGRDARP